MFTGCHINNFKIIRKIGSGAYGLVFQVEDIFTGYHYAIKIILKNSNLTNFKLPKGIKKIDFLQQQLFYFFAKSNNNLTLPSVDLQSIIEMTPDQIEFLPHYNELHLHLNVMQHDNVVTIHQVLESQLATMIVMDYYPRDLFTSIVDHLHFVNDPLLIKKIVFQLCSVLQYCNDNNVYHCDLKPENILLDDNDNVMLCDFGLATMQKFLMPNICIGSSYYMAPERIAQFIDTNKNVKNVYPTVMGDIWSLGILIINLTCTRNPWSKASILDDRAFAHFNKNSSILLRILPISQDLFQLLDQILRINPLERINYTSICEQFLNLQSFTKDGPLANFHDNISFNNINITNNGCTNESITYPSSNVTSPYDKESETSSLIEQQSNYSFSSDGEDDIGYEKGTKIFLNELQDSNHNNINNNNEQNWDWKKKICLEESTF